MNNLIPKIANLSWPSKDVVNSQSPIILNGLKNLIEMNPDWKVIIHDDNDVDDYLKSVLDRSDYNLIRNEHIVAKTDLWRLIKLYSEGGLYIDIDRLCNVSLSDIITDGIQCVLPTCSDWDFSQDFMLTAPNNIIFLQAIELNMQRRREGHTNVFLLGPQTYMHAITIILCNEMINTNPGVEKFNEIRQQMEKIPSIKTYRETSPYDTIIYKHDEKKFNMGNSNTSDYSEMKKQFYAEYNIKHWMLA